MEATVMQERKEKAKKEKMLKIFEEEVIMVPKRGGKSKERHIEREEPPRLEVKVEDAYEPREEPEYPLVDTMQLRQDIYSGPNSF